MLSDCELSAPSTDLSTIRLAQDPQYIVLTIAEDLYNDLSQPPRGHVVIFVRGCPRGWQKRDTIAVWYVTTEGERSVGHKRV